MRSTSSRPMTVSGLRCDPAPCVLTMPAARASAANASASICHHESERGKLAFIAQVLYCSHTHHVLGVTTGQQDPWLYYTEGKAAMCVVVVVAEQLMSACASGLEYGGNVGQRRILLCRHNAKRNQLSTATQYASASPLSTTTTTTAACHNMSSPLHARVIVLGCILLHLKESTARQTAFCVTKAAMRSDDDDVC